MPPRASSCFSSHLELGPSRKVQRRLISPSSFHSIGTDYSGTQRSIDTTGRLPPTPLTAADIRPAQVFHDSNVLPTPVSAGPSGPWMPPLLRDGGLCTLGRHPTIATSSQMNTADNDNDNENDNQSPSNEDIFGQLPGGKPRTFILVEDPQRGSRVRVKVGLDKVKMQEIPDSYRKSSAVYPRTYFPTQMKDAPGRVVPGKRFFRDDTEQTADPEDSTVGRTTVPAPSLDGERDIEVPKLSRRRHRKEVLLNDLGYRLSWCQSRIFAGRMLFLQRSRMYQCLPFFLFSSTVVRTTCAVFLSALPTCQPAAETCLTNLEPRTDRANPSLAQWMPTATKCAASCWLWVKTRPRFQSTLIPDGASVGSWSAGYAVSRRRLRSGVWTRQRNEIYLMFCFFCSMDDLIYATRSGTGMTGGAGIGLDGYVRVCDDHGITT